MILRSHTRSFWVPLMGIILFAFVVRLYKITTPLADWHSFRQSDTASVTREYIKHGINLLRPTYQDLSNIQSGVSNNKQDNVEGLRMVEFPIINGVIAVILRTIPGLDLVIVSRLSSIMVTLCGLVAFMLLVRSVYGDRTALLTGGVVAVLPYSIYYSRTILPDPYYVAFALIALYTYQKFLKTKQVAWIIASTVVFGLALLVKPMAIFFLPVFVGLRFHHAEQLSRHDLIALVLFPLSVIPLYEWRMWIQQFPLGIPESYWLLNGGGIGAKLSPVYQIRFKPAWWRWIFYERLTKLFLGYVGTGLFFFGFLSQLNMSIRSRTKHVIQRWGRAVVLLSFALGSFAFLAVFAAGNVQHDYYQIMSIPFVSLAVALGIEWLWNSNKVGVRAAVVGCVIVSLYLSWQRVSGYYHINNPDIIVAGRAADRLLPADAKVIAPYTGDTTFLFHTNRTGWPIGFDIDQKIREGAQYYVSVNLDDEANALMNKYTVIEKNDRYVIVDLTKTRL